MNLLRFVPRLRLLNCFQMLLEAAATAESIECVQPFFLLRNKENSFLLSCLPARPLPSPPALLIQRCCFAHVSET